MERVHLPSTNTLLPSIASSGNKPTTASVKITNSSVARRSKSMPHPVLEPRLNGLHLHRDLRIGDVHDFQSLQTTHAGRRFNVSMKRNLGRIGVSEFFLGLPGKQVIDQLFARLRIRAAAHQHDCIRNDEAPYAVGFLIGIDAFYRAALLLAAVNIVTVRKCKLK